MMPPEDEDDPASQNHPQEVPEAPSWTFAEKSTTSQGQEGKPDEPNSSRSSGQHSSSHRDRSSRHDDQYYRSQRERNRSYRDRDRDRDRDRERDRDRDRDYRDRERDYRDRNYGSSRHRDSYRDDRYNSRRERRERRSRSPEEARAGGGGRKHSSRSRSRSKDSHSRDARDPRGRHRSPRDDRSHGGSSSREAPRERVVQDRLSAEIEQELANLRRQHDLKEAYKQEQQTKGGGKDSKKATPQAKANNKPSGAKKMVPAFTVVKPQKPDFVPYDVGTKTDAEYVPEIQTEEERIEFQRKMQEKLQQHLASEGKLYPPPAKPKCEQTLPAAVSGFANDGSFLEMFKQFQQQVATVPSLPVIVPDKPLVSPAAVTPTVVAGPKVPAVAQIPLMVGSFSGVKPVGVLPVIAATIPPKPTVEKEPPPPPLPVFGRRRGGKILKTGLVKKVRPIEEATTETPSDPWSLYLQEVKKYKSASCDADSKTRPLVK